MKASKAILYSTSAFLIVIWTSSFMISYTTLVSVATSGGLGYPWAYLWPLCLDSFMTIASLDVIRRELNNETTIPAWFVVVSITIVSTVFNVTQAQTTALSWAVHALSPIVCCISFEIFMGVLRSHFRKQDNAPVEIPTTGSNPKVTKTDKRNVCDVIAEYYRIHPDSGYAEAGKALGISRQVVRSNVMKMSKSQNTAREP